jgi:alcohol dehydrogenase
MRSGRQERPADQKETAMIAVDTMKATVFHAPGDIRVEDVARPRPGPGEALIRITLTTICGTDVHIVKGE